MNKKHVIKNKLWDAYLGFLFFGKVIFDVEGLTNLLRSLPLDHIGNSLARNIKQTFDV